MASINLEEVSYSEICTFLKTAQTSNMSIAAQELHVSQPAVSKRIASLEEKYGIILFVRTSSGLQLTPAGKAFYHEALTSMEYLKSAFIQAAEVQAAPLRTLHLGYDEFFDLPILFEIIHRFYRDSPQVRVQLHLCDEEDCANLFRGSVDLMICPDSFFSDLPDKVRSMPIDAFQFSILVAKGNPLYNARQLLLSDLQGVPLTVARSSADSPYILNLKRMFQEYGFSPVIAHMTTREELAFELLSHQGVGIATPRFWRRLDSRTAAFFDENIRIFPIEGEVYPVSFVWRKGGSNPDIPRFLQVFQEVSQQGDHPALIHNSYN